MKIAALMDQKIKTEIIKIEIDHVKENETEVEIVIGTEEKIEIEIETEMEKENVIDVIEIGIVTGTDIAGDVLDQDHIHEEEIEIEIEVEAEEIGKDHVVDLVQDHDHVQGQKIGVVVEEDDQTNLEKQIIINTNMSDVSLC